MEHEDTNAGGDGTGPGATNAATAQFQRAARDAVASARAVLDAVESMVDDPAAFDAIVDTVNSMARSATEVVAGFAGGAARAPSGTDASAEPAADEATDDDGYHGISIG